MFRNSENATHDEERKHDTEDEGVGAHDPPDVMRFDDPGGKGDSLAELLLAVGVTEHLKVVTTNLVRKAGFVCIDQYAQLKKKENSAKATDDL